MILKIMVPQARLAGSTEAGLEPVTTALPTPRGSDSSPPTIAGLLVVSVVAAGIGSLIGLCTFSLTPVLIGFAVAMGLPAALVTYGLIRHLCQTEPVALRQSARDLGKDATA